MASKKDPNNPDLFAGRFEKIKLLGVGLVGEVCRARDTQDAADMDGGVALKILRTGQDASLIKNEALILGQLWREEENLKDGIHSIPRLITADDSGAQPFLAMEFIRGKQVSQVLRESESDYLDEALALNIGSQLFRVLFILHEKINKTYSDLKIENFWWLPDDKRLKVTDWNVLQDRKTPLLGKTDPLLQDLFRASVSLYWMLTGELPDFQSDLNAERLQHASNWGQLSDGVKDLLSKLLGEESLKKIGTAYQIKAELDRLLLYWKEDIGVLKKRTKGKGDDRLDAFSVLSRRVSQPDDEFTQIERELQESVKQRNDLTRSIALFGAGSYGAAKSLADEAYPHASEPHIFLWWKLVIELAEKIESRMKKSGLSDKVSVMRDFAVKSINAYQKHDYQEAEKYFEEISRFATDDENIQKAYSELSAVLKVQNLCARAQETHEQIKFADEKEYKSIYDAAWKDYVDAFSDVRKISTASLLPDFLSFEYLKTMVATVEKESKVAGMVKNANVAFEKGGITSAEKMWREGFKLNIDDPKLVDSVVSAAQKILDAQNVSPIALQKAEGLLLIIPSVVSNYSLACNLLRKQIQTARLALLNQTTAVNEIIAVSQQSLPVESKRYDDSGSGSKIYAGVAEAQDVGTPKEKVQTKPKQGKIVEHVEVANAIKPINTQKVSGVKPVNEKKLFSVESKKDTSFHIIDVYRDEDLKKADDLISRMNSLDGKEWMTIDKMSEDVENLKSLVQGKDHISYWKVNRDWCGKYVAKLKTAQNLWQQVDKLPLDKREDIIDRLKKMGFYGKKTDFEQELCIKEVRTLIQNKELTINILSEKVKELTGYLIKNDPQKGIERFKDNWKNLDNFDDKLKQANSLWQKAIDSPLEKRDNLIKDLNKIGFYGKEVKNDFDGVLYIDILRKVYDARLKESKIYYDVVNDINDPQNDERVKDFLHTERAHAKDNIIEDVKKNMDKNPAISEKLEFLWTLTTRYPEDERILELIFDINRRTLVTHPKPPEGYYWDAAIDYYYYLAHLAPRKWNDKKSHSDGLDKWSEHPYIRAKYGEKIFKMKDIVRRILEIKDKNNGTLPLIDHLSGIYERFKKSPKDYRYQIRLIIELFDLKNKLNWNEDECMSWYDKLCDLEFELESAGKS